jgi:hypothetical protein
MRGRTVCYGMQYVYFRVSQFDFGPQCAYQVSSEDAEFVLVPRTRDRTTAWQKWVLQRIQISLQHAHCGCYRE